MELWQLKQIQSLPLNQVLHGNCLEVLKTLEDNSVDSIVTDPPYELGFMGKKWDSTGIAYNVELWKECLRVLKPGGHLLAFGGTRTYHRMACAIEDAGFEIRDQMQWIYGSGFPKSHDISKAIDKMAGAEREVIGEYRVTGNALTPTSVKGGTYVTGAPSSGAGYLKITAPATPLAKKWDGWGTNLKPSHEPIIMARKPLIGTVAENVERWGTGAINVDGCRIPHNGDKLGGGGCSGSVKSTHDGWNRPWMDDPEKLAAKVERIRAQVAKSETFGRFPANCVTTEPDAFFSKYFNITPPELSKKASKKDRNSDWRGEEITLPERVAGGLKGRADGSLGKQTFNRNTHPTVKPTDLMAWLVRLVTPPGGIVLDPFAGSGSTLVAAKREGFQYIGIEREAEYVEIAKARVG